MIELFYAKGVCSMAVHILLCEVGAPHKMTNIPLDGTQKKPEYLAINPKGSVPAIRLEDGTVITEVAVILQYIADKFADKKLMPAKDSFERYRALEWMNFTATELHKGIGSLFVIGRMLTGQSKADAREMTLKKLHGTFNFLGQHLSKSNFMTGPEFSAVDAYAFTVLGWTKPLEIELTPYPAIMGYLDRLRSRPSVQEAMKAEGLI